MLSTADPLWFKDAVIYQLHVKAYFDSNDDGIGDFRGLTSKLDYIASLGVDTIWLMPFNVSPLKDDGYDVADYTNINPQYGDRQDFRAFMRVAKGLGLRVIAELVMNHTSDQHPWFQAARRAPAGSRKRDFYVWSDSDQRYQNTRIIFTDTEKSNWTWDPVAKAYFWHRFFSHQPDLNFDNPSVLKAMFRVMQFWLDMGVDGFRLDAIPYLVEREGTSNENLPETHAVIRQIRALLDARYPNRLLLAEANQWPEDVREYFGESDECHMAYHFPLMPRMYMAIAQEDRHPIVDIMQQTPEIPEGCQWAIFLRNHDELTLEMVTGKERDYMYRMYAADTRARINLGIRRRLAPLMENDRDRIKLMNSLLLSMPGSPIIYYGDEIGMGDNIFLGDRDGVRTPMQWSPDRNAGFSRADPQRLYLAPIADPIYGFQSMNVEAQLRDPSSLLNWMKRILAVRKSSRAFGRGRLVFLKPRNRKVLAYLRELGDEAILCVANVSRTAQPVQLDLARYKGRFPVELMGRTVFPPIGELPYLLTLPAHGFYWFRLGTDVDAPHWMEERAPRDELPVIVLFDGWTSFFRDRVVPWRITMALKVRDQFERDVLPAFIQGERWFAAKGEPVKHVRMSDQIIWRRGGQEWLLAIGEVEGPREPSRYFLPFALAWDETEEERVRSLSATSVARVRQQAKVGLMGDAFGDESFCRALVAAIGGGEEVAMAHGRLRFSPTVIFSEIVKDDIATMAVSRPEAKSSNSIVTFNDSLFLKGYRRLRPGLNPEVEVGRFLSEVARFPNCVPVAGVIEYTGADGTPMTVGVLQAYVANQGDGWSYTLDAFQRLFEDQLAATEPLTPDAYGAYLTLVRMLGLRTAELHRAFMLRTGDPAFDPEPATNSDVAAWREAVRVEANAVLDFLRQRAETLPESQREAAQSLLARREQLARRIDTFDLAIDQSVRTRYHGDFHLGQVLLASNDFIIIDFEGEPARPLAERRRKHSPLRDVAGMLRSFGYARATALQQAAQSPEDLARLTGFALAAEHAIRHTFLQAYGGAMQESGLVIEMDRARGLIDLFEIEKALYELRYELTNRPEWVSIPIAGIAALIDAK